VEIFNDTQLNALEQQVNISNQNLKAAEAQYAQARALVRYIAPILFRRGCSSQRVAYKDFQQSCATGSNRQWSHEKRLPTAD